MHLLLSGELVGRERECRAVTEAIESARSGRGGAVAVIGEAGIGKSRLRRFAEAHALDHGLLVLPGRAAETPGTTPFRPLAEALSTGFRSEGSPRDPAVTAALPTLAHLVPHWSTRLAPHSSVLAIAEAVLKLLQVAGRDRGALLVLEDLHWADQDTLAVVEYLLDSASAHGAMCLFTLRPDPPGAAQALRRAADRRAATVIELGPLPPDDADRMALACLGQDAASAELLAFLRRHADGVPFFVEELLAGLARAGTLTPTDDGWAVNGTLTAQVPTTFAASVTGRLHNLSGDHRRVLVAAALLGRDIDWRPLPAVTGLSDQTVWDGLRAGSDALLLDSAGDTIRFRHALTRECVQASAVPPERATLAGRALAVAAVDDPELVAELAVLAGDRERAAAALLSAAEQARDRGALATAAARLERALGLAGDSPTRLLATERLAEVRALSGDIDGAIALAGPALAARRVRSEDTGDGDAHRHGDDLRRAIDLELVLARAALTAGSYEVAQAHTDRAGAAAATAGDRRRQARTAALAAQIAVTSGAIADAERLAEKAIAAAGDELPEVRCEALEVLGRCRRLHDVRGAEEIFESSLAEAERHGLLLWRARALHELGTIDLLDRMATDRLVASWRAAVEAGSPALAAVAEFHLASALVARNELADGRAAAQRAVDLAERLGLSILAPALTVLARSYAHARDPDTVATLVERITRIAGDDPAVMAGVHSHVHAMLALHRADRTEAREALDRSAALLRAAPGGHDPQRGLWALLCTLDGGGEEQRAEVATAAGSDTRFNRAMLRAAEAVAAGRAGHPDTARAEFAAAVTDLRGYHGGSWMAHLAQWLVAPAAFADGWGDPAALQAAVRWFTDHRYEPLAASCRRMLREAGVPVPRAGRGSSEVPDALRALGVTSREVDVLQLVVAGLSNRDIARQLVLSPKTVEKHVANLLDKTGRPDRAALRTAYGSMGATRQGGRAD